MIINPKYVEYLYVSKNGEMKIFSETPEEIKKELKEMDEEYYKKNKKHLISFN